METLEAKIFVTQMSGLFALAVALLSGIFALVGAYIGAKLARRTEYDKWLRQNRSEAYAELLTRLARAQEQSSTARQDPSLTPGDIATKIDQAYRAVLDYAHVVRLYLPERNRTRLTVCCIALREIQITKDFSIVEWARKAAEIQRILEEDLHGR